MNAIDCTGSTPVERDFNQLQRVVKVIGPQANDDNYEHRMRAQCNGHSAAMLQQKIADDGRTLSDRAAVQERTLEKDEDTGDLAV